MGREIITSVERRRNWPDEEKLGIMSEALVPGATAAAVADRNGVCRSLLYTWLRHAREGRLPGIALSLPKLAPPAAAFAPVTVPPSISVQAAAASSSASAAPRPAAPQ
jgi:transposase